MKSILIAIISLLQINLMAQITGEVIYDELGICFTVPDGWVGQESEEIFIMGSNSVPGIILMIQHEYTDLESIRQDAEKGLEDEGLSLALSGKTELFGNNGIGAEFSGTINGQAAKAYLLSLLNPYGSGVTIMTATETEKYSDTYKKLALAVGKSVQFSKIVVPAVVQEWKKELMNKRLSYLYSSSSRTSGYSGLSEKEEIWLCAAGYFNYKSNSGTSFDTGGAFGYSSGKDVGNGTWDVISDGNGGAILQLLFQDGRVSNYNIKGVEKGKLYLGGYGYFWSDASGACN